MGNAVNYRTGVIMEGMMDVWSFGPMGVCTLGAAMTKKQQSMFVAAFKDHSGILLFDPDAMEKPATKLLMEAMKGKFKHGFARVILPDNMDPGSLERNTLRAYVQEQAEQQGCKVSWKRRS
jgi:DNA primase